MKKTVIVLSLSLLALSSCDKDNINPSFNTRILTKGTKCTISPHVIGQDGQPTGIVIVDSMDWKDTYYNNGVAYFDYVYVTQADGRKDAIPDEDLINCK